MSTVDEWATERWTGEARHIRDVLAALGVSAPFCLPGEPSDCGGPVADHHVTYLALLNARVAAMAQANLNEAPQRQFTAKAEALLAEYGSELERGLGGEE